MIIVGLRDKVSSRFEGITMAVNEYVAKRDFSFAVNNNKEMLFKAKDLELYKVGEFDVETGQIDYISPMVRLCSGDEVKEYD